MCFRIYEAANVISFQRPRDPYGIFHNFSGILLPDGAYFYASSEAMYQAHKFPDGPHRLAISDMRSPYDAKRYAYAHRVDWRPDWEDVKIRTMRSVLNKKFMHSADMRHAFDTIGSATIVEESSFDQLWGAKRLNGHLVGHNLLGRLLMELRAAQGHVDTPF